MVYLGGRAEGDRASMESGRLVTDRQADLFRRLANDAGARGAAPEHTRTIADKIISELDGLPARRRAIDTGAIDRDRAFADYTALLGDVGALQGSSPRWTTPRSPGRPQRGVADPRPRGPRAGGRAARRRARRGRMTAAEHARFVKLVGTQRALYGYAAAELRSADQAYYQRVVAMPEYGKLRTLENRFVGSARYVKKSAGNSRRAVEDHRRLQPDPAARARTRRVRGRGEARRADRRRHHHPRRPRGRARARRRRRVPRPRDLGRPVRHPGAGPAAPRGDRPVRGPAARRDPCGCAAARRST